jgi:hypothetical protein
VFNHRYWRFILEKTRFSLKSGFSRCNLDSG